MVSAAGTGLPQASHWPDPSTCPPSAACRNCRRGPSGAEAQGRPPVYQGR